MALIVQKFGGTSVGTPGRIRKVSRAISQTYAQGHDLVVVVSAMGHTTDRLITLAHQITPEPAHREMDMLLTAGERISMALLSMALRARQIPAISLTGSQSGIITDGHHRRARIQRILGERIREGLAEKKVVIVAGFQGVSPKREVTTLGRGGSDTSAVALAVSLEAAECQIYTDVSGVYSTDPSMVPQARLHPTLPYDLMVEMAAHGASVLDLRSVELARRYGLNLRVALSYSRQPPDHRRLKRTPGKGTQMINSSVSERTGLGFESYRVTGVSVDSAKRWVTITLARPTVRSAIWAQIEQTRAAMISPVFGGQELSFFTDQESLPAWSKALTHLEHEGFINQYTVHEDMVPISVVGDRFFQDGSIVQEIFSVLDTARIPVASGSACTLSMTLAVSHHHAQDAVSALHRHFFEILPTP